VFSNTFTSFFNAGSTEETKLEINSEFASSVYIKTFSSVSFEFFEDMSEIA